MILQARVLHLQPHAVADLGQRVDTALVAPGVLQLGLVDDQGPVGGVNLWPVNVDHGQPAVRAELDPAGQEGRLSHPHAALVVDPGEEGLLREQLQSLLQLTELPLKALLPIQLLVSPVKVSSVQLRFPDQVMILQSAGEGHHQVAAEEKWKYCHLMFTDQN